MQLREHYLARGPEGMSDAELLALVLGTGVRGHSALRVAQDVLELGGGVSGLRSAEPSMLAGVRGMGIVRALRVGAAVQLGRRALRTPLRSDPCTRPDQAHALLSPGLIALEDEELHGLFLDRRRQPLAVRCLTRGSHAFTIVDPRQILRVALKLGASAVILAHNHPSGDPTPSATDLDVTERVARAGKVIGVPLLDHLVIAGERFESIAERVRLPGSDSATLWTS